jgi:hypothetical protein
LGESEIVVGNESDRVGDKGGRLEAKVVNNEIDILRLELDPGDGDLLDETNDSGDNDVHKVSVETLAFGSEGTETNLTGGSERVTELLDRVDELVGGLVVLDTVNETLELVLELLSISLPVGVLLQQCLGIVKQA